MAINEKMKSPKFKVGDKVRILPSAVAVGVPFEEIGKTGVIKHCSSDRDMSVYMDMSWFMYNQRELWSVDSTQIELSYIVGQQLLFAFMEEE